MNEEAPFVYKWKSAPLTCQDIEEINELLKQLTPDAAPITINHIAQLVQAGYLLLAWDRATFRSDGQMKIVGMATLVPESVPPLSRVGHKSGTVEDVVVYESQEYRRKGIGTALNLRLIEKARAIGLARLQLTSRPSRKAANKMYRKLGYKCIAHARYPRAQYPYDTNLYRLELP